MTDVLTAASAGRVRITLGCPAEPLPPPLELAS